MAFRARTEPLAALVGRAHECLQRGHAVLDTLVVDASNRVGVVRGGIAHGQIGHRLIMATTWIGTSGWSYKHWENGNFYPPKLAAGETVTIQFTPHLIPINRGILTTLYLAPEQHFGDAKSMQELAAKISACYQSAYGQEPFVRLLDEKTLPDTKNVAGTNVIEIAWRLDVRTGRLVVMSAEDNLVKGASGQAIQSMNIMCGFPETAGLV